MTDPTDEPDPDQPDTEPLRRAATWLTALAEHQPDAVLPADLIAIADWLRVEATTANNLADYPVAEAAGVARIVLAHTRR